MQKIDISGQRFGSLTVIKDSGLRKKNKKILWQCICDCGKEVNLGKDALLTQVHPSCGCQSPKKDMFIGHRVGRLTVTNYLGTNEEGRKIWECTCDCGKTVTHSTSELNYGSVQSCGCLKLTTGEKLKKYNSRDRKLYFRWSNVKGRCYNPNNAAYKNYGGRGIEMCDEWRDDFYAFRDWSIEHGYNPSLSLDRIDNNKGYSPDNCRWTDDKTQSNNRRSNAYVTINGETKTMMQWADIYGIKYATIQSRLSRGWSRYDAITKPVNEINCPYKHKQKETKAV